MRVAFLTIALLIGAMGLARADRFIDRHPMPRPIFKDSDHLAPVNAAALRKLCDGLAVIDERLIFMGRN
jgi:hypothetical protein